MERSTYQALYLFFSADDERFSLFKLFEHEQYYVFVNICKRFKVLYNFEQFTIPERQRIRREQKRWWALGKAQRRTANLQVP